MPAARTVVLRGFDANLGAIAIHSDYRSRKVAEITKNDRAAALFYDPRKKIQIRTTGHCRIHYLDDLAIDTWRIMPAFSRRCHLAQSPGSLVEKPFLGLTPDFEKRASALDESEKGFPNFVIIRFKVLALECL